MNYQIAQLDEAPVQRCPCGFTQRVFAGQPENAASLHLVDIQADSQTHYHRRMTELYLVLEGEGQMELDGKLFPVKPMTAIYIRPGCRHRAIGITPSDDGGCGHVQHLEGIPDREVQVDVPSVNDRLEILKGCPLLPTCCSTQIASYSVTWLPIWQFLSFRVTIH